MNKLKTIILALGCLAALGLTSCLDNDNDNNQGLTQQQLGLCVSSTRGSYSGKMLYSAINPDDSKDLRDTLSIGWSVTPDTMLVVNRLPSVVVADYVNDERLKEALLNAEPAQLRAYIGFYAIDPVSFLLYPRPVEYTVNYNGGTHKVSLAFWINTYTFGYLDTTKNTFFAQMLVAGLFLDENEEKNYLATSGSTAAALPIVLTTEDLDAGK